MITQPVESKYFQRMSQSLISIVIIIALLYIGQHILIPFAFACLFSLLLIGPCGFLERLGLPRGIAGLLSVLFFIFIVTLVIYFISSQLGLLKNDLPLLVTQLSLGVAQMETWIQGRFHISTSKMDELLQSLGSKTLSGTTSFVGSTFSTLSSTILYMILVPIYTFLLLFYRGLIFRFLLGSFATRHSPTVSRVVGKTRYVIRGYIVGLMIEMIIVAAMNCAGFLLLGVKYALLLGVIAALLNIIPYLGIFIACILSVLITYTTDSPATVAGVAIVLIVVHLIDSNIILPKVVGSKVKINALVTILGVVSGSAIWGIPGMFLAIPVIAILKVIFDASENLQPWGMLLGDDVTAPVAVRRFLPTIKKRVALPKRKTGEQ